MISFGPDTPRQRRSEPIVPMINVVFLLLIFFLMTAVIAPPDPFDVDPPRAEAEPSDLPSDTLFIAADGSLAYEDRRGTGVFAALRMREADSPLAIRADAGLPAAELARLLPRLAAIGIAEVDLITVRP